MKGIWRKLTSLFLALILAYDGSSKRITSITDGAGRVYAFSYSNSLLSSIAFKGTGSTVISALNYAYDSSHNLTSITYPDGEAVSYYYSEDPGKHLLYRATDVGGYSVHYSYTEHSPYRVASITESDVDDEGNIVDGGHLAIQYAHNETTFTDHNGNKEIVQFNNYGSTISVQDGLGRAQFAQYAGQDTTKSASQMTLSSKLQNTVSDIIRNGSFETSSHWAFEYTTSPTGSKGFTTEEAYMGARSLKITRVEPNTGYYAYPNTDQGYNIEPGKTYTLSAYVKTTGTGSNGVDVKLSINIPRAGVGATTSKTIKADSGWTQMVLTYKHPENATQNTILPVLSMNSAGTVYFDCVQLIESAAPSRYNLVENGDFKRDSANWTKNSSCASTDTVSTVSASAAPQLDTKAFKITGKATSSKTVSQTITLSGNEGDVFTLAGWGKGDSVPLADARDENEKGRKFGLSVTFIDSSGSAGKEHIVSFNPDGDSENNWQYAATRVVADKNYTSVRVSLLYCKNMNTAYFDGIQLYKEEFGQSYVYDDATGLVTSVIDLQQKETTYEYESNQLTAIIENGTKTIAEYEYDDYNNVKKATAEDGTITYFAYDTYGNNTAVAVSDSNTQLDLSATNFTVESGGPVIASFAEYTPDGNYLKTVTDALGNVTEYTYNSQTGVLLSVVSPYSANEQEADYTTTYDHDTLFRTTSVENGSAAVSYGYGCLHICTESCTDPCSHICSDTCDPDGADLLRAIVSASETQYTFTYGIFDLLQNVKVGTRTLISHEYSNDANRYLTKSTYGNNDYITYAYDKYGRTTSKTYEDGDKVSYAYDNNGNLGLVTDSATGRTTKYLYDFQDRLSRYEELGTGYSSTVEWSYNTDNELTSQKHILNGTEYVTNYSYDEDHQLKETQQGNIIGKYTYDKFGRMTNIASQNGQTTVISTTIGFTNPSDTTTSSQVASWSNSVGSSYTYEYDARGNITKIKTGNTTLVEYTYDSLDQLTVEKNHTANKRWEYTYDNGGNIKTKKEFSSVNATSGTTKSYYYGDSSWRDLLTSYNGQTLGYDGIGNLTSDGTWSYAWEHGRQLAGMSKPGTNIAYTYNADGMRISKNVNGTVYNYHYLGDQLVEMTWGSNKMSFVYDVLGPAAVIYNGTTYYYTRNAQGDVTGIVNASGTQVVAYNYDAWGNLLSTTGTMAATLGATNPLRYRGYVYDTETGLYYLQSRYYNPSWGRFINADEQLNDGLLGNNQFAYCNNNPVNLIDPDGNIPKWIGKAIAVATAAVLLASVVALTVVTFGAGSVAGVAAITTAITIAAKATEVAALQIKKSADDKKKGNAGNSDSANEGSKQIVIDAIEAVFDNGAKIIGFTPITKAGTSGANYLFTDITKHKVVPLELNTFLKSSGGKILPYGLAALSWTSTVISVFSDDPITRAEERGYRLK